MRLGILGGSFNPVHHGHMFLAETALAKLKLDRVVLVPAYKSPFKQDAEGMQGYTKDRIDMLACATSGDCRFAVDTCEIDREGVSFTIDTLQDIIERFIPTGKPVLIIGDDLAVDFLKWRDSDRILQLADIAVAQRINAAPVEYPFPHIKLENEITNISSLMIREKIAQESSSAGVSNWRSLVPPGVRAIIQDRRLYGLNPYALPDEDCTLVNIQLIEAVVKETISTERFIHSKNTALHAVDLCCRFGVNPAAGYLAGIAHDLAKQMDNKLIIKILKSDGHNFSALEKEKPNLLHGKAAAVLLKERFCITNREVLEAIAYHTSGSDNMGALAKIIYIADKTESSRNIDPVYRRMCREDDLDSILYAVLEKTVAKLRSKELVLFEETLLLLNKMKGRKN